MNLILNCPVELVARLLGDWLTLGQLSRLDVAFCSDQHRPTLMTIYESIILKADGYQMLDWLVTRRIKVSSLQMLRPLSKIASTKLMALITYSRQHLLKLNVHSTVCAQGSLLAGVSRYCVHIRELEVRGYSMNRPFFQMLSGLHNLRKLRIVNCTEIQMEHLSNRIHCPLVESLYIDDKMSAVAQLGIFGVCSNLTSFELRNANEVDLRTLPNTVLSLVVRSCRQILAWQLNANIYRIKINKCCLRDEQLDQIFAQCPNIQYIDLGHNYRLSEAAVVYISEFYNANLLGYEIAGCRALSVAVLHHIVSKCNNIRNLDISYLERSVSMEDSVYMTIAQNCPMLRYLAVHGNALTDSALITISQMQLESLMMQQTYGYGEEGIMALVTGCARLQSIAIDHFLITKNSLVKLMWQNTRPLLRFL